MYRKVLNQEKKEEHLIFSSLALIVVEDTDHISSGIMLNKEKHFRYAPVSARLIQCLNFVKCHETTALITSVCACTYLNIC